MACRHTLSWMAASVALVFGTQPCSSFYGVEQKHSSDDSNSQMQVQTRYKLKSPVEPGDSNKIKYLGSSYPLFFNIWEPFEGNRSSLRQMLNTVDCFFNDTFFNKHFPPTAAANIRTPWDVKEDDDAFMLRFDMPGLSKEEVKVSVEGGELVIKGEHNLAEKESKNNWSSRSYFNYNTRMSLPENVTKLDEVKVELKNGVLHIIVPKSEEAPKKKAMDINVE